jgi:hypothetical protein
MLDGGALASTSLDCLLRHCAVFAALRTGWAAVCSLLALWLTTNEREGHTKAQTPDQVDALRALRAQGVTLIALMAR